MGFFGKKKEEKKTETKAVAPEASEKKKPSIHNVKVPEQVEAPEPKAAAAKTASKAATVKATPAKTAPAKAAATKAAATKTSSTAKAPATAAKPAAKKAPAKVTKAKTTVDDIPIIPRPFFMKTDEDIRLAFDEAIAAADAQILKNSAKAVGKYEFELEVDGYHFYLIANNGQVLFDSPGFSTLIGALNGVDTFKKTVKTGNFDIRSDKYGRYRFILERKYFGENYTTKDQCQKCADSVKNFANNAKIIR